MPLPQMGLRTRLAAPADLAEITDIAVAAFHPDTDAITRHLFPPHPYLPDVVVEESVRAWREMRMAMKLRARDTTVVVAVDDAVGGKVVGFSMWDRPVKGDKAPDSVTTNTPCPALDNDALAEVYHVLDGDIHKHFGVQGLNDMFYLDYIAVVPPQQRRGIGKLLLDWGMKEAAQQKRAIYLVATPAGRPLYRNGGFDELGIVQIFDTPHYSMIWRYG